MLMYVAKSWEITKKKILRTSDAMRGDNIESYKMLN